MNKGYSHEQTYRLYFRVRSEKIGWLKFILEGYDGLTTLSTVSVNEGLITLWVTGSAVEQLFAVMNSLAEELTPYPVRKQHEVESSN